ncbi:hypothetical protein [Sphingobium sp. LF-16]|uniref:helix-turn-helix transcriptional regulator n=1 Tax=Sphingobium sp. LF-16 TaxID=2185111 RepID=UPI003204C09C
MIPLITAETSSEQCGDGPQAERPQPAPYRKAGTFPKQIRIATRCMGWRESATNDWVLNPMFWTVEDADARQRESAL